MKAVIFDMDGVIIDSEPIHYICTNTLLKSYGIQLNRDHYDMYIGASCKEMWDEVIRLHGIDGQVEEFIEKEHHIFLQHLKENNGKIQPIEGINEILDTLKSENIPIALASSSSLENINLVLDLFNIHDYFIEKVSGFDLKRSKPDPEIFMKTAKLLHVDPKECVVIEDSTNGVTAAKRAGMKCIGYRNPNCGNQDLSLADIVVKTIRDIDMKLIRDLF